MIRVQMTEATAETLSSFLTTAAERFKADAETIRAELKGKPHAGLEAIAAQFDRQEAEARAMALQFGEVYPVERLDDMQTIDPAPEVPTPDQLFPQVNQIIGKAIGARVVVDAGNVVDLLADNLPRVPLDTLRAALAASRYGGRWPTAEKGS